MQGWLEGYVTCAVTQALLSKGAQALKASVLSLMLYYHYIEILNQVYL